MSTSSLLQAPQLPGRATEGCHGTRSAGLFLVSRRSSFIVTVNHALYILKSSKDAPTSSSRPPPGRLLPQRRKLHFHPLRGRGHGRWCCAGASAGAVLVLCWCLCSAQRGVCGAQAPAQHSTAPAQHQHQHSTSTAPAQHQHQHSAAQHRQKPPASSRTPCKKGRRGLDVKIARSRTPPRRGTASRAAPWHCGEPKGHLAHDTPRPRRRRFREKHSKTPQNRHSGAGPGCNSTRGVCIPLIK